MGVRPEWHPIPYVPHTQLADRGPEPERGQYGLRVQEKIQNK